MPQPPPTEALIAAVCLLPVDLKARVAELSRDIDKPLDQLVFEAMNLLLRWHGRDWDLPPLELTFAQEFELAPDDPAEQYALLVPVVIAVGSAAERPSDENTAGPEFPSPGSPAPGLL